MKSATTKPKIEKLGTITTASVHKATGRHWDEWVTILDKVGASTWPHKEIAIWLKKKYKLKPWWQQSVALCYEYHIGRRIEGRNAKGEYSLSVTKTLNCDAQTLWKWLVSSQGLAIWLTPMSPIQFAKGAQFEVEGGIFGEIRTFKKDLRMRLTWQEEEWSRAAILQIYIVSRPNKKCLMVFTHEGLKTARAKEEMRVHWREKLIQISDTLQ